MQAMVCHTIGAGLMRSTVLMPPAAVAAATAMPPTEAGRFAVDAIAQGATSVMDTALETVADISDAAAASAVAATANGDGVQFGGFGLDEDDAPATEPHRLAGVKDVTLSDAVLDGNPAALAAVALISPLVATPLLSLTATLFWWLAVFRELRHASESVSALVMLPRRPTQLVWSGDTLVLMSVSLQRLCFVGAVLLLRFCVAVTLLVVGSPRLLGARSPMELLICVPALGFALEIPRRMAGRTS
ncbi:unnamed protein product [Prorocentrum cordatum]|uniref:Uncharacterized protein n=1 Tax=Prorocentrum cordatum TaxID=2364126 RepID=A0ABN9PWY6_9DINO|nr:unnamed protein product [Polarella glacialis]